MNVEHSSQTAFVDKNDGSTPSDEARLSLSSDVRRLTIELSGGASLTLSIDKEGATLSGVEAPRNLRIASRGHLDLEGVASVRVHSSGTATVEASGTTDIIAGGVTTVRGGLVKIN